MSRKGLTPAVVYDRDLRLGLHAKRIFDAVGHYSRDDALAGPVQGVPAEPRDTHPPASTEIT